MHPACFVFLSTIPAPGRVVKKNFQISALFPAGGGIARKNAAGESAAADAAGRNAGRKHRSAKEYIDNNHFAR